MNPIDFTRWEKLIKEPTWYFEVASDVKSILPLKTQNPSQWEGLKKGIYDFFEHHLKTGDIVLGKTGKNWDSDRKPIDTVIIHHTQMKPGLMPLRLSAITLIRLYTTYYAEPYDEEDKQIKGAPIYSGHFRNGEQVFWPYHWIVRNGGTSERLLNDNEIGWQAGKWDVNCRSVAIVLDNNYENGIPSDNELSAVAEIIKKHYPNVKKENILGHREVNPKTTCPSNLFLSENGQKGWKENLLGKL